MNENNVSTAKPRIGGAIYRAPLGSMLPTDATTALNEAFANMGYVSEDGVTNANSPETDEIKAWGGDIVATPQTGKKDTFSFMLVESKNENVLKAVYGDGNVTGTLSSGISVKAKNEQQLAATWVIDIILKGNTLKRIVIPTATITEIGDITYKDDDLIGYEVTITAMPDYDGVTHHEYIKG